ncbi:AraC family transcriptional regulator N-terminal domain-containing protein [Nonomuraea terrae]|uniref:AraC family transcriptional regulator n=1 Tax=Nonomuraea terrae TaxID=2530383 RepID=UPI00379C042C
MPLPPSARLEHARDELTTLIGKLTSSNGKLHTTIPGMSLYRYSSPTEPECDVAKAQLVLPTQGSKQVVLGERTYSYGGTHGLITAMDLPLISTVTEATPDRPYLSIAYELHLQRMADLMADMRLPPPRSIPGGAAISVCALSAPLFDVVLRLVRLLDTPADIPFLAPLIEQELLYRLLTSEQGMRLRHLVLAESQTHKIAQAITWIREHYTEPLRIAELARHVHMSPSSLHHHFKTIASMTPLQYQKQIRLYAARRLMISHDYDAATAAYTVGYSSPSQFSREYRRIFGVAPSHDVDRMHRNQDR